MVPNSYWSFCPSGKNAHSRGYHKVFESKNYLKWFKEYLLANLNSPSLITLDNAKYHKSKPKFTPQVSKMKRGEIVQELQKLQISFSIQQKFMELKETKGLDQFEY